MYAVKMMRPLLLVWATISLSIRSIAAQDSEIKAAIEYTELQYEDSCKSIAEAEWAFVNKPTNRTLLGWETRCMEHGNLTITEKNAIGDIPMDNVSDSSFRYKYEVISKAGDAMMNPRDWQRLVSFSGTAELVRKSIAHKAYAQNYSHKDIEHTLSHQGEAKKKRNAWIHWYEQFKPLLADFIETLPLTKKAAEANDVRNVKEYWEMLSDCPNGYENALSQWTKIIDLHRKIVRFIGQQLSRKYGISIDGETIPAYLLGSSRGYDWTKLPIDVSVDKNLIFDLRKNLWKEKMFGVYLYKSASSLSEALLNGRPEEEFWTQSRFDQVCPSKLVNFCGDGAMRVAACADASIANYLAAHRDVGKVSFYQISRENTPTLNIANRYSGLEEGVSELFGILSASPSWLNQMGLIRISNDDSDERQIDSLLITALDVLPRLAYYVSTDLWRINAIEKNITKPTELITSWWNHRREYEAITPDAQDVPSFLSDDYIMANKPYLAKYMGILLGFQLYEYLMSSTEVRYNRIDTKANNVNFMKMIQNGAASSWMEVLNNYLEIHEISIEALLSFFEPLDNFLDEIDNNTDYTLSSAQETEIEYLEKTMLKQMEIRVTATITPTAIPITVTRTRTASLPVISGTANGGSMANTPSSLLTEITEQEEAILTEKSIAHTDQERTKDVTSLKTTESYKQIQDNLLDSDSLSDEENNVNIGTSKAVWSVAAVLMGTIVICIIVIFGRKRCRKTPKNRRYV